MQAIIVDIFAKELVASVVLPSSTAPESESVQPSGQDSSASGTATSTAISDSTSSTASNAAISSPTSKGAAAVDTFERMTGIIGLVALFFGML